tara:strand:- start:184 stop:444 length:261 start_codon:yes stop_codon:yes gene_type:complete
MVEAWLAVAIMMGVHDDGMQDLLVFKQPKHGHFHNVQECTDFVNKNPEPFIRTMWKFYGQRPVERIVCVRKEKLKEILAQQNSVDS